VTAWTPDDLAAFGGSDEVRITSLRPDGTARKPVPIWIVRLGDQLYVRSAYGPENGWYRRARAAGVGRIAVRGRERDVAFEDADPSVAAALHAAYHAKYDRYGERIVGTVVSPEAAAATLRVLPRLASR
jgi:hypothetical protein